MKTRDRRTFNRPRRIQRLVGDIAVLKTSSPEFNVQKAAILEPNCHEAVELQTFFLDEYTPRTVRSGRRTSRCGKAFS
jgi:hypothetical protein